MKVKFHNAQKTFLIVLVDCFRANMKGKKQFPRMPSPGSNKQHFICLNFHFIRIREKKKELKKYIFPHILPLMSRIERRHLFSKHFMNDWIIDHFPTSAYLTELCLCLGQRLSVRTQ